MKFCSGCNQTLPTTAFSIHSRDGLMSTCKPCNAAYGRERRRQQREQKLAAMEPWQREHAERQRREQDARRIAKEARRTTSLPQDTEGAPEGHQRCTNCAEVLPVESFPIRTGDKRHTQCRPCMATYQRERYQRIHGGTPRGTVSPERRREIVARVNHLAALLAGTVAGEYISDQEGWDMTTAELSKLWHRSGDKECVTCKEMVPPERMRPPGPVNFYPGQCNSCAHRTYERHSLAIFGTVPRARLIPMNDGSSITIGELARRHRDREASRKVRYF